MTGNIVSSAEFRRVLGHYPTGVCAITAMRNGQPIGMIVGSFTSVSLEPALVAFLPDRNSRRWAEIEAAGDFCVNVLSEHQQALCRRLSSKGQNGLEGTPYRLSNTGLPIIEGAVAWIECKRHAVHEAGDHYIVVGEVQALAIEDTASPLLFLKGGYGGFIPSAA